MVVIDEDALVVPQGVVAIDSLSSTRPSPPSGKAIAIVADALLAGTSSYSSYPGGSSGWTVAEWIP